MSANMGDVEFHLNGLAWWRNHLTHSKYKHMLQYHRLMLVATSLAKDLRN